jgi:hypothetical protein
MIPELPNFNKKKGQVQEEPIIKAFQKTCEERNEHHENSSREFCNEGKLSEEKSFDVANFDKYNVRGIRGEETYEGKWEEGVNNGLRGSKFGLDNKFFRKKRGLLPKIQKGPLNNTLDIREKLSFRTSMRIMTIGSNRDVRKREKEQKSSDIIEEKNEPGGIERKTNIMKNEDFVQETEEHGKIEKKIRDEDFIEQKRDRMDGRITFLKPKLIIYEYIYKEIIKVDGLLVILTVKKHLFLKFWKIALYFPLTARVFECPIHSSVLPL